MTSRPAPAILVPPLARHRVRLLAPDEVDAADAVALADRFRRHVRPALTPVAVDAAHPFPRLPHGGLALLVEAAPRTWGRRRAPSFVVVPLPAAAGRLHRVPTRRTEPTYVLVEDLVRAHLGDLLGAPALATAAVRVTRVGARRGGGLRVQHEASLWPRARTVLVRALGLGEQDLVATDGFAALVDPALLYEE